MAAGAGIGGDGSGAGRTDQRPEGDGDEAGAGLVVMPTDDGGAAMGQRAVKDRRRIASDPSDSPDKGRWRSGVEGVATAA